MVRHETMIEGLRRLGVDIADLTLLTHLHILGKKKCYKKRKR